MQCVLITKLIAAKNLSVYLLLQSYLTAALGYAF
jgi:hypothetical protein